MSIPAGIMGMSAAAGAGLYFLSRVQDGVPSYNDLCYLMSSREQFNVKHVAVLRRLAVACNYNVDNMMVYAHDAIIDVATREISDKLPPQTLPANTSYSLKATFTNQYQQPQAIELAMYEDTGVKAYELARKETIATYCRENMLPLVRNMCIDAVDLFKRGYTDWQVYVSLSAVDAFTANPDLVLPDQTKKFAYK